MSNHTQSSRALAFILIIAFAFALISGISTSVIADGTGPIPPAGEPPDDTTSTGNSLPENPQESQLTVDPALLYALLLITVSSM